MDSIAREHAATLSRAAKGDSHAQLLVAEQYMQMHQEGIGDPTMTLFGAEMYARMAAYSAESHDISLRLAAVLFWRAGFEMLQDNLPAAVGAEAEAIAITEIAADGGNEKAAEMMAVGTTILTADGLAGAARLLAARRG